MKKLREIAKETNAVYNKVIQEIDTRLSTNTQKIEQDNLSNQGSNNNANQNINQSVNQSAHQGINSSDLLNKIKLADLCIKIDKGDHNSYYAKAGALIELWQLTNEASCFERAIESYTGAINLVPDNALYLCDRGKAYHSSGKENLANQDLTAARQLLSGVKDDTTETLYVRNTLKQILGDTISSVKQNTNTNADLVKKKSVLDTNKVFKPIFEDAGKDNIPQIQIKNQEQTVKQNINTNTNVEKRNSTLEDKVLNHLFEDTGNENMPQIQIQSQEQDDLSYSSIINKVNGLCELGQFKEATELLDNTNTSGCDVVLSFTKGIVMFKQIQQQLHNKEYGGAMISDSIIQDMESIVTSVVVDGSNLIGEINADTE